jgi:hypothetical protein
MLQFRGFVQALACAGLLGACHGAPTQTDNTAEAQQKQTSENVSVLGWVLGWDQLQKRSAAHDTLAEGPSAIAMTPDGAMLLLDRLAGRIVRIESDGASGTLTNVPVDAEDLAVGPDGAVVAMSFVRATAWLYEADGKPAGELKVPRALRQTIGVELGPSRTVMVRTGYQEMFTLGSPSTALPFAVATNTKTEGAFKLPNGSGVQVVVRDGEAHLLVLAQATDSSRAAVTATFAIGEASAGRIVGTWENVVCLRLEQVSQSGSINVGSITVTRSLECIASGSGQNVLSQQLPATGMYLPRRELAVGAGQVAFMLPTDEGVAIQRWTIGDEGTP